MQTIPFLVPPYGRPVEASQSVVDQVRQSVGTKEASDALHRIAGTMPVTKRIMDVVGASIITLMLSPMLAVVAACVKFTDGGPILFWQRRVGIHGREFWFPKFRSMMVNADRLVKMLTTRNQHAQPEGETNKQDVTFKMKDDPRITWIGKIIRKLSIDEMPQLWCVLKGDMSLVGPRPPLPREVARYTPSDRRRLAITPGLTPACESSATSWVKRSARRLASTPNSRSCRTPPVRNEDESSSWSPSSFWESSRRTSVRIA